MVEHTTLACAIFAHRRQRVAGARKVEKHRSHTVQAVLEGGDRRRRRLVVEQGNFRKRALDARQLRPDLQAVGFRSE